ncbi:MAG: hypothetical protein KatS3mg061_0749 [Dehalococcoidia bacterium]|nr:MAG: hypothetical protein KatS3mg061_0749 [Dehalococcoidia bacterium]
MTSDVRLEKDSLGTMEVPAHAYYGAQTRRAELNFPISDLRLPKRFLRALAQIKRAAAEVNRDLGLLDPHLADAIIRAADEVIAGRFEDQFVVDVFQTGSGTSTNMNMNEVIANRAIELLGGQIGTKHPVHPNDHVNLGQSSNDTIPTALQVAAQAGHPRSAAARPGALAGSARPQERGVLADYQDGANPPPRRNADPARAGVSGLPRPGGPCHPAAPAGLRGAQ